MSAECRRYALDPPENKNPGPLLDAATGADLDVSQDADDYATNRPAPLVILATRLRVPMYLAAVYARLAGWQVAA